MCQKIQFATKSDAKDFVKCNRSLNCKIHYYFCSICEAWHTTRMNKVTHRKRYKKRAVKDSKL